MNPLAGEVRYAASSADQGSATDVTRASLDLVTEEADLVEFDGVVAYSARQLQRVRELLASLAAVRRLARFYPADHPAVGDAVTALFEVLSVYHGEGADAQMSFHDGEVIFGEHVLTTESILFDQLVREFTAAGIGTLIFRVGLSPDELRRAVPLLSADSVDTEGAGGLEALRRSCNVPHIFVGEVHLIDERIEHAEGADQALASYKSAVSLVHEIDRLLSAGRAVSASQIKGVVRGLVDNVITNQDACLQLSGLKSVDEYTYYHSANVAILAIALGSRITDDRRFLTSLGTSSLLHDIGKLAIDAKVLNKPGALTPEEWALVRLHPVRGAEMAALIPGVDRAAVVAILEHHMRYDLVGYPQRTPRRPQHLSSRIVAIADTYDAMTSRRAYSAARPADEAMALIAKISGTALDPTLARLFIRLMGVYPPRSVVGLSNGEIGIVLRAGLHDPALPYVRIIAAASGNMIEPADVDLATVEGLRVSGCLDQSTLNIAVEDYL